MQTSCRELNIEDLELLLGGEAVVADSAHFGAGDGDLDVAIAGDLIFQLVVEMAFEFPDFPATKAGHVDVIAWAVCLIVVAVTAEVEKVEFIDEAMFLEEIDSAVDGDQVDFGTDFLGEFEDLVDVEMLFGVVHNLKDYPALTSKADATLTESVLEMAGGVSGVDSFAGRDSMGG